MEADADTGTGSTAGDRPVAGMAWMLAGGVFITIVAVLVKLLVDRLSVTQIALVRSVFLVVAILPFLARLGRSGLTVHRPVLMATRAVVLAYVTVAGFWTLSKLPIVYVTTASFAKPLFITLLAALLLGERVGWRRSLATAAGFLGVLVMLMPGATGALPAVPALVAISVAVALAAGVIMVKHLVVGNDPSTIIFYCNLGVVAALIGPVAADWTAPDPSEWLLLAALGVASLASQNCFIRAYRAAEASLVAPFEYVRILFSATAGFLVFAEVPQLWTGIGAAVIVAATLYLARREAALRRQARLARRADCRDGDPY